jgi:hypothetical protein
MALTFEKLLHGCQLLRLLGPCLVQLTATNYKHSRASTTASVWAMFSSTNYY